MCCSFVSPSPTVSKFHLLCIYIWIFEWMCLYILRFSWDIWRDGKGKMRNRSEIRFAFRLKILENVVWTFGLLSEEKVEERSINFPFDMNPLTNLNANRKFITPEKVCAKNVQFNFVQYFFFSFFHIHWESWRTMLQYIFHKCSSTRVHIYYALVSVPSYRFDLTNGIEVLLSVWFTSTKLNKLLVQNL